MMKRLSQSSLVRLWKGAVKCFFICLSFMVAGCTIGPKYTPPIAKISEKWSDSSHQGPLRTHRWWRDFHDPILNALIEQKSLKSLDIKLAEARVKIARAEYRASFAELFPALNFAALPPDGTGFDLTQVFGMSAGLSLDLFGKQRLINHTAKSRMRIAEAEKATALLNLRAEIASSYIELREAQAKHKMLGQDLIEHHKLLDFIQSGYKKGVNSYLNVAQQEAFIQTQMAELEQLDALINMIMHKIEVLTGNQPGQLHQLLKDDRPIPHLRRKINLGVPAALLKRRPDIVAAELGVEASHTSMQAAIASLLPQINIGWLLAWQTQSISSFIFALQNSESTFFGTMNAPLLNLNLYAKIDAKKREKHGAILLYHLTVLRALHEVETQYSYYQHYRTATRYLKEAMKKKRLVLTLIEDSYRKGASPFNPVLLAEEDLQRAKMAYIHQLVLYQTSKINLYKALGGDICSRQLEPLKK